MQAKKKDIAWTLGEHIASTGYEQLGAKVVETTKKAILDTLGIMAAASGLTPQCKTLVELITEAGGKEESTIVGFGARVPAWMAAFANGALAHSLDYDDLYYEGPVHTSSPVVSAALAMAERLERVSGKQLITAVALGNDLTCRLAAAMHWRHDWNPTTVLGAFGAAAAAGKLLALDTAGIVSALGTAMCEAAGTQEMRYSVGNHLGTLNHGYPARGGVFSALMAARGIIGPENSLEGRAGLFNVYFGGNYDREMLTANLGKEYLGTKAGIKAWPTTGTTHVYVDATLQIVTQHSIAAEDIEAITLHAGEFAMAHCQPIVERRRPQTMPDAKYSIPFTVAIAATRRKIELSDLTAEGINNPAVLATAQKVNVVLDSRFDAAKGEPPGLVKIQTKDGKRYEKRVDYAYGHYRNPVSTDDVVHKFHDCVSYSYRPITRAVADSVVDTVMTLENSAHAATIVRALS